MLLASTMASFLTNLLPSSGGAVDTTVNAAVDMAKASQRAPQSRPAYCQASSASRTLG